MYNALVGCERLALDGSKRKTGYCRKKDSDKAAALHVFFSSVYTHEPDGDFDTIDNLSNNIHTKMSEVVITKDNVYRKLCNLNIRKSAGPDMLHPRVLYECRDM